MTRRYCGRIGGAVTSESGRCPECGAPFTAHHALPDDVCGTWTRCTRDCEILHRSPHASPMHLRRSRTARSRARLRARHGGGSVTREDLRPRAETTLRDLCALLYPATVGHDVVVYAAGDGPWSARWRWAARVVDGRCTRDSADEAAP